MQTLWFAYNWNDDPILECRQIYPSDRAVSSVIFLAEESREIVGAALAGQRIQRAIDEFGLCTVFKKR